MKINAMKRVLFLLLILSAATRLANAEQPKDADTFDQKTIDEAMERLNEKRDAAQAAENTLAEYRENAALKEEIEQLKFENRLLAAELGTTRRVNDRLASDHNSMIDKIKRLEGVIKSLQGERAEAKAQQPVDPLDGLPLMPAQPAVGDAGKFKGMMKIVQVIDGENVIIRLGSESAWLRNTSTLGMVDDRSIELTGYFEVVGTTRYETALGSSRTIPLIEPASIPATQPVIGETRTFAGTVRIMRIVDDRNVVVGDGVRPYWLTNVSTSGLENESRVAMPGRFRVMGTAQYESVAGAPRTIPLLEAIVEKAAP